MSNWTMMEKQHLQYLAKEMRERLRLRYAAPPDPKFPDCQLVPLALVEELAAMLQHLAERSSEPLPKAANP